MAFNGSGTFSLVSGNPVVTGTTISSTWANNTLSDIANNGLTNVIVKDGQTTITANLPMAGFIHTGVGNGSSANHYPAISQVQNFSFNALTSVSGANTITGNATPTPSSYSNGQMFIMLPVNDATGQPTLNVSSIGAIPIFWNGTTATSNLIRSGRPILTVYSSTASATAFHMIGNSGFIPAGMITARGQLFVGSTANSVINLAAPASDDSILVSSASNTAGMVWKGRDSFAPTITTFTATSTTTTSLNWTKPSGLTAVIIEVVSGGGGGGGGGAGTSAGTAGHASEFGAQASASAGAGGQDGGGGNLGGSGGLGASGDINVGGCAGSNGQANIGTQGNGAGTGGSSALGGGGIGQSTAGENGRPYGGGGGGGGSPSTQNSGGGGGGGGYSKKRVLASTLAATETVKVGGGGTAGSGTHAGGTGAAGIVIVTEFY